MKRSDSATLRNLPEWLSYLEQIHPSTIELGLERTQSVYGQLSLPGFNRVITVAGTNGKGTTCRAIEAMAIAQGVSVGVYSSPHLIDYRERVRVNDQLLSEAEHCWAFQQVENCRTNTSLTYFEFGTLAALVLLAKQNLDLIILEVGLGGRLDAVNIVDPDVAVITTIDLDHQDWLGNSRDKIATEKAGILRHGKPAIIGELQPPESLFQKTESLGCAAVWQGQDFGVKNDSGKTLVWQRGNRDVELPDCNFPLQNMATAIAAGRALGWPVEQELVNTAFSNLTLPGRCQLVRQNPDVIVDVAHNPQATHYLLQQVMERTFGCLHLVCGMLCDKDSQASLQPFTSLAAKWYLAEVNSPRSAKVEVLKSCLSENQEVEDFVSISEAYSEALTNAEPEDLIVVFGSFFTVAEVFAFLGEQQESKQE
ncbi:MAG: bifunctional tetrahydrofolate synthase/dihydrofolate synthase [Aestuariibacter sp.]